ncbi:MAG: hypothetical protein II972_04785 [Elusimicrobiaceae bacterium]|nr:hypothetical protein [Elusimicrobiaceae bacterium]
MQENNSENKKSSKEMWLFLIFLDIAALCVFAYFIYHSFGGEMQKQFAALTHSSQTQAKPSKTFVEEIIVEEDKIPATKAEEKPAINAPKKEEPKETAKEAAKTDSAPKTEPTNIAKAPAEAKKQSVFISGTGKTRKVTFKYYGEAKKVAIVSGFTSRKPVALTKKNGVWETTLVLYPGDYKYMYIVDNVETLDPGAPAENGRSLLKVR